MMITKYQRVTLKDNPNHGGFYETKEGVREFLLQEDDPDQYLVRNSLMTTRKINKLHEFQGF